MKLSLMTTNMVMPTIFKFQMSHDIDTAHDEYEEMFDMVEQAGYEAVDVTSMELDMLGEEYVRKILDQHGIKVSSYIYFDQFADGGNREDAIRKGKDAIDTAKRFGAKVAMMVPIGQPYIEKVPRKELAENMIACWKPITAYGKEQKVHIVVENTPDLRLPLCATKELQYVLDAVPDLEVVFDSGNMMLVYEDPVTYFETFKRCTAHIHIKDMQKVAETEKWADIASDGKKMMAAPTGTGLVDIKELLKHVKESGYDGYLTVEFCMDVKRWYVGSLIYAREYIEKELGIEVKKAKEKEV